MIRGLVRMHIILCNACPVKIILTLLDDVRINVCYPNGLYHCISRYLLFFRTQKTPHNIKRVIFALKL